MANTLKFGNGTWATKKGSILAYNDENENYKPLPFNYTGFGKGTRVNKEGLIEVVENDRPRIDYLGNTKGALLLEPERINLQIRSEEFDNSIWSKTRSSITPNDAISPSGLLNADKLVGVSGANSYIFDGISVESGSVYTISVFAKYIDINEFVINVFGQSGSAYFNIENGTVISNTGTVTEPKIENYGNGWYRCSAKFTANATGNVNYGFYLNNAIGKSVHIWGAQFELGNYPTSYIPTSGGTVTRVADVCNNGANEQVINSTEGVLYVETSALSNDLSERRFGLSDGTSSNVIRVGYTSVSNRIIAVVYNGSNQAVMTYTSSDITQNSKIAVKYKENDFALWVDGVERSTDTSGSVFSANTLNSLDFNIGGSHHFYSKTKDVRVYNTALTDAQLQALTQ